MNPFRSLPVNTRRRMIASALAFLAQAVFAQTNLVVNGSFEAGPIGVEQFTGWGQIGPGDNHSDYGVTNLNAFPDVAEQGTNYAYFHGDPTDGSQDCLGQTVLLTVGATYNISFYLATDGPAPGTDAYMIAVIGTSFGIDYSQDVLLADFVPNSTTALPYQFFSTNIVAAQVTNILSFHGVDGTSAILLDNVTMTLVAPPAPSLNIGLSATNSLVFSWLAADTRFRLEANSSLSPTNWVTLTNAPLNAGFSNQIVLPSPAAPNFYRLRLAP